MNFGVLLGRKPGEMLEVVDEMCLVVKTALERNGSPVDIVFGIDRTNCFLKPHYLEIGLWVYTDLLAKHLGEVFLRIPDLAIHVRDVQGVRPFGHFTDRELNTPIQLHFRNEFRDKKIFKYPKAGHYVSGLN
jgi:hypothetical protein